MTDTKTQDEHLPCELTHAEVHARGEEIAKLWGDQEEIEFAKKDAADLANRELKKLQAKLALLSKEIRERREHRWVPVKQVRVENAHLIQWIRTDTDAIVRERPMTELERQLEIFPGGVSATGEVGEPPAQEDGDGKASGTDS
jgi:hypothetical protein